MHAIAKEAAEYSGVDLTETLSILSAPLTGPRLADSRPPVAPPVHDLALQSPPGVAPTVHLTEGDNALVLDNQALQIENDKLRNEVKTLQQTIVKIEAQAACSQSQVKKLICSSSNHLHIIACR